MSWSVNMIGKADKLHVALDDAKKTMSGDCLKEYDGALPCLHGLLDLNMTNHSEELIELEASGHWSYTSQPDGKGGYDKTICNKSCQVSLKKFYKKIVL